MVEIIPELGGTARERLRNLGYRNAQARIADGYDGWPEQAPFDVIVVTAAAEYIPPPLLKQLKEGGPDDHPRGRPVLHPDADARRKEGGSDHDAPAHASDVRPLPEKPLTATGLPVFRLHLSLAMISAAVIAFQLALVQLLSLLDGELAGETGDLLRYPAVTVRNLSSRTLLAQDKSQYDLIFLPTLDVRRHLLAPCRP